MRGPKQTEEERKAQRRACTDKWATAHPEKTKKIKERWMAKNKEHAKAYAKGWRIAHPEKTKAYRENFEKAHPGKNAERRAKRRKECPGIHRSHLHNRRARKIANGGKLSSGLVPRLIKFQKNKCVYCGNSFRKSGYHMDHVVPLSLGGKNEDRNIQLTCPRCNKEKSKKDPVVFAQEKGFLL